MDTLIITCEHGGNRIPAQYRRLFRGQWALLDSHRGYGLCLRFPQGDYVGIELEVNQGIVLAAGRRWTVSRRALIDSLRTACAS